MSLKRIATSMLSEVETEKYLYREKNWDQQITGHILLMKAE